MATNQTISTDFNQAVASIITYKPGAAQQIATIVKSFNIKPNSDDPRSAIVQKLINEAATHHIRRHNIAKRQPLAENSFAGNTNNIADNQVSQKIEITKKEDKLEEPTVNAKPKAIELPSAEHAERLERVRETVKDIKELNQAISDLQVRATGLVASAPTEGSYEAAKLWEGAIAKLKSSLNRLIQISDDNNPATLLNTKHKLENMVALFEENALGAEGIGLQEDEQRLKNFEARLESIDPIPSELIKSLRNTLADKTLSIDFLEQETAKLQKTFEEDRKRISKINEQIQELKGGLLNRVINNRNELTRFKNSLAQTLEENALDADLVEKGKKWLESINLALAKFPTEASIESLVDWAEKFRSDQSFTGLKLKNRIKKDLIKQLVSSERTIGIQKSRYNPQILIGEAGERKLKAINGLRSDVGNTANKTRKLYQDLIALRRKKMGEDFDERFSGEISQNVSSLIEDIVDYEVRLIRFVGDLSSIQKVEASLTEKAKGFKQELALLTKRAQNFLDSKNLEDMLSRQLIALVAPLRAKIDSILVATANLNSIKDYLGSLPATQKYTQGLSKVIVSGENLASSIRHFIDVSVSGQAKKGVREEIENTTRQINLFIAKANILTNKQVFLEKLIKVITKDAAQKEEKIKSANADIAKEQDKHTQSMIATYKAQEDFAKQVTDKLQLLNQQTKDKLLRQKQSFTNTLGKLSEDFAHIDGQLSGIFDENLRKKLESALGKLDSWLKKETSEINKLTTDKITLSVDEMRTWLEKLEQRKARKDFIETKFFALKDSLLNNGAAASEELFTKTAAEINQKADDLNLPEKFEVDLPFDKSKLDSFKAALNSTTL